MDIDNMSDQEKSVMLARLSPDLFDDTPYAYHYIKELGGSIKTTADNLPFNLYNPALMALAWRVLNWAMNGEAEDGLEAMSAWNRSNIMALFYLGEVGGGGPIIELPPAAAQRAWLDRILELAIEAGLVKVETPESASE